MGELFYSISPYIFFGLSLRGHISDTKYVKRFLVFSVCERKLSKLSKKTKGKENCILIALVGMSENTSARVVCNFIKKEILAQVFSCEFCQISKNTFFHRKPLMVASTSLTSKNIELCYPLTIVAKYSILDVYIYWIRDSAWYYWMQTLHKKWSFPLRFLRIWPHFLMKSLMENFNYCAVKNPVYFSISAQSHVEEV